MKTWLELAILFPLLTSSLGCSSSSASSGSMLPAPCYGPGCVAGGASNNGGAFSGFVGAADSGATASTWSPLCGPQAAGCVPESDAGSCDDLFDGTAGPAGGDAGINAAVDAGSDYNANTLTCRIQSDAADAGNQGPIVRVCEPAGVGGTGAPCRVPTDCGKGLTCVAEGLVSLCRNYCCADPEACPSNTYCTSRSTVVANDPWTLGSDVPVCTAAENCPLSDPYPCPQGKNCTCPAGKACMIVRRHGLTACVTPGDHTQGQFCPCAAGYVCSNTTFTCLKLCQLTTNSKTQASPSCSVGNTCQASSDVPPDWGVCNDVPLIVD